MSPPTRRLRDDESKQRNVQKTQLFNGEMEKDDVEIRLEKLLFGDEADFMNSLTAATNYQSNALTRAKNDLGKDDEGAEIVVDEEMEDLDEEMFFIDTSAESLSRSIAQDINDDNFMVDEDVRKSIWVDSDDERLMVSLASNTRLRKLRDTENDDMVNGTEYVRRLRRQYERLHPMPEWVQYAYKKRKLSQDDQNSDSDASIDSDVDASIIPTKSISDLLRTTEGFTKTDARSDRKSATRKLRPEVVDIQRLKDIATHGPSSIDTMQFHPYFPLLLSGGPSSTVNLYHVSPQSSNPNPLVTSLHLKNTPLHTAAFCRPLTDETSNLDSVRDNTRIFVSSRRRYFHTWSLTTGTIQKISRPIYGSGKKEQKTMESFKLSPCGQYMGLIGSGKKGGGTINVLSTETMQWICACRIDSRGGIADFAWWRDGTGFVVVGKNGEVSEYDVEQKRVVSKWLDEGAVGTTIIALGGEIPKNGLGRDRWVAVGSSSGIVNIYDRRHWTGGLGEEVKIPQRPKPERALDQLTTPTSHLEFSSDGQMMVMGSRWKKNALRLIHLPSCTVYRNWPTDKTPLGRISSIALSIDGSQLAVANEQGKIRLFQIRE